MTPEIKEYIIEVLRRSKGDDLERATYAFSGLTAEQMTLQHGQSGETRQQIFGRLPGGAGENQLRNCGGRSSMSGWRLAGLYFGGAAFLILLQMACGGSK